MNTSILKSKKFITACITAVTQVLTFLVSKYGLSLDVESTIALMTGMATPFLMYIGAEGFSTRDATPVVEPTTKEDGDRV